MDIKGLGDAAAKIANDKEFQKELKKDPEKAIEKKTGIDIPDGAVDKAKDMAKKFVK